MYVSFMSSLALKKLDWSLLEEVSWIVLGIGIEKKPTGYIFS